MGEDIITGYANRIQFFWWRQILARQDSEPRVGDTVVRICGYPTAAIYLLLAQKGGSESLGEDIITEYAKRIQFFWWRQILARQDSEPRVGDTVVRI